MSTKSMDVFALRDSVVREYEQFATSLKKLRAAGIRDQVRAIYAEHRYWPEPVVQINSSYKRSSDVAVLASAGNLDSLCERIFRLDHSDAAPDGFRFTLYKHQEQALAAADSLRSTVGADGGATGTS